MDDFDALLEGVATSAPEEKGSSDLNESLNAAKLQIEKLEKEKLDSEKRLQRLIKEV